MNGCVEMYTQYASIVQGLVIGQPEQLQMLYRYLLRFLVKLEDIEPT